LQPTPLSACLRKFHHSARKPTDPLGDVTVYRLQMFIKNTGDVDQRLVNSGVRADTLLQIAQES